MKDATSHSDDAVAVAVTARSEGRSSVSPDGVRKEAPEARKQRIVELQAEGLRVTNREVQDHAIRQNCESLQTQLLNKLHERDTWRERIKLETELAKESGASIGQLQKQLQDAVSIAGSSSNGLVAVARIEHELEAATQNFDSIVQTLSQTKEQTNVIDSECDRLEMQVREAERQVAQVEAREFRKRIKRQELAEYQNKARKRILQRKQAENARAELEQQRQEIGRRDRQLKMNAAAQQGLEQAVKRLANSQESVAAVEADRAREEAEFRDHYIQSLLDLRKQNERVKAEVATNVHRLTMARRKKEEQRAVEREQLRAAGKNAEAVFAARDEAERLAQEVARAKSKIRRDEMNTLDRVLQHESSLEAQALQVRQQQQQQKQVAEFFGRHVVERRVEDYLKSRTIGGKEVLDTTGEGFFPSEVTLLKTRAFGMGTADPALLELAQAQMPDVAYDRSVVGEQRTSSAPTAAAQDRSKRLLQYYRKRQTKAQTAQRAAVEGGKQQVVCGRTFSPSSPAFVSNPERILFQDFAVGQERSITATLTNISLTFNTVRLLPLPQDFPDCLEVSFTPCGRLAAGKTTRFSVTFRPTSNEDVEAEIPFLAETGPFTVPVTCVARKASVALSSRVLDFGEVIIGEKVTQQLALSNAGALDVPFHVEPVWSAANRNGDSSPPQQPSDGEEKGAADAGEAFADASLRYATQGVLKGYDKRPWRISFAPQQQGEFEFRLHFHFGAASASEDDLEEQREREAARQLLWDSAKSFEVVCKGKAVRLPVYVDGDLDMQNCVVGKLYRTEVPLRNAAKQAYKVQVQLPAAVQRWVQVTPQVTFVQPQGAAQLSVRFEPDEDLLQRVHAEHKDVFEMQISVTVADFALPLVFAVRARLVCGTLSVSPPELVFDGAYVGQSTVQVVTISNQSPLLQKLAFVNLPPYIEVQPDDGLLSVLPHASTTCTVRFVPDHAMQVSTVLNLRTKLGDTLSLPLRALADEPPLALSHALLRFAPVADGAEAALTTTVTNTSQRSRAVEIVIPSCPSAVHQHFLTVSPSAFELGPNESKAVLVQFAPRVRIALEKRELYKRREEEEAARKQKEAEAAEAKTSKKKPTANSKDKAPAEPATVPAVVEETKTAEELSIADLPRLESVGTQHSAACPPSSFGVEYSPADEVWSRHGVHRLACWTRSIATSRHGAVAQHNQAPVVLQVETTIVQAAVRVAPSIVEFGAVPVGEARELRVTLRNDSSRDVCPFISCLPVNSPFTAVTSAHVLSANATRTVFITFRPSVAQTYAERIQIQAGAETAYISVSGSGVRLAVPT